MKKLLFLSIVALFAASCSNDDDQQVITEQTKLVKAEMKVSASQTQAPTSRAYLGHIDDDMIGVKFNVGDNMDIYEFSSYQEGTKYVFTNKTQAVDQSPEFSGTWSTDEKAWTAIFPSSTNNKMVKMSNGGNGGENIYQSIIPQNQETINAADGGVTYKNEANIMVAAQYFKESITDPSCFLVPIVCYLYFASDKQEVDIVSTAGPICGPVECTTSQNAWSSSQNFNNLTTTIVGKDATAKTIHSKGLYTTRSGKYEHIVCMIPGTFDAEKLTIDGTFKNSKQQKLKHINMYYLGDINPAATTD